MVLIEIKATCEAAVTETWTLRVPEALAPHLLAHPVEVLDLLDHPEESGCEIVSCLDEVSDERDRTVLGVRGFDAGGNALPVPSEPPSHAWQVARAAAGRTPR